MSVCVVCSESVCVCEGSVLSGVGVCVRVVCLVEWVSVYMIGAVWCGE